MKHSGNRKNWEELISKCVPLQKKFSTVSDLEIPPLVSYEDLEIFDASKELGYPGLYPFTRGIHPDMYRGRIWTMRQFAGFGTAEDTNRRFKYLLENGQTGLSVAFDMPTIMGRDSDDPRSRGEVGVCGVAIDSLADMEVLFKGIPLDKVTTSMTINAPASILLAMYIATAEKQGVSSDKIGGTIQNDILKEYIAQKSWIFPPKPSMRIITDIIAYCTKHVPRWNTISISGYHIREAGSTAAQELGFTLADGIAYVQACVEAGLKVDDFAGRLSFFFNAHNDLFEEVAKYRAARRMWAKIMKERFGAQNPRSMMLRFHTQTAGCSLTAQQPEINIVRVAIQALAAVLGGTQSLHTNSLDETHALPTEKSVTIALRTQQIIAEESGVANTIDPLGGSYFVEYLTNKLEEEASEYIRKIDEMGGMIKAIEAGYPQKEIQQAAYHYQIQIEKGEKTVVGVNKYITEEPPEIERLKIDEEVERKQVQRVKDLKARRDNKRVKACLERIGIAAREGDNLMPHILEAVRSYATLGEIIGVMREEFGEYQDPAYF